MTETTKKSNEEMLAEVYRNCQTALSSITDILPEVEDESIKTEIKRQHEEYEKYSSKACALAKDLSIELKEVNPMKKAMMWGAIKMNTLADNSAQHISELMLSGTVTGIKCLRSSYSDSKDDLSKEVNDLVLDLLSAEESFEETYKQML